jgi:ANTAR domain
MAGISISAPSVWAVAMTGPNNADDVNVSLEFAVAEFNVNVHRAAIEQAKGILMHLLAFDADHAFAILSRYSQTHHVKVQTLAAREGAESGRMASGGSSGRGDTSPGR